MFPLWPMPRQLSAPKRSLQGTSVHMARVSALALLLSLVFGASTGSAQSGSSRSDLMKPLLPVRLEGHGALSWDGFAGAGFRAEMPLIDQGVMYDAHDELAISAGSDFIFLAFEGSDPLEIWPTVVLQWSLGLNDRFVFYPELGLAAKVDRDGWQGVFPNVGFGGRYYVWRSVSAMARFGWPMALSLGASF